MDFFGGGGLFSGEVEDVDSVSDGVDELAAFEDAEVVAEGAVGEFDGLGESSEVEAGAVG